MADNVEFTDNGDRTVTFHRTDLPAVADPEHYDIRLTYKQIESLYISTRIVDLGGADNRAGEL